MSEGLARARELRQQRARILRDAEERKAAGEADKFDKLLNQAQELRHEIEAIESREEGIRQQVEAHERRKLGASGEDGPVIFRDGKTGKEIRGYRADSGSLYADEKRERGWDDAFDDLTIGGYFRAIAVGDPKTEAERRALSSTGGAGNNIPAPIRAMIFDRLKNQTYLGRAGAIFLPMDSATTVLTRVDTAASFNWHAEGSTHSGTDPTFAAVTLNAKTYRGVIKANRELVQDAADFPAVLEREIVGGMREKVEEISLRGTGSGSQPTGLLNSTAINNVNFGGTTAGAAPSSTGAGGWLDILQARQRLLDDNTPDRFSMVWAPRTERQFGSLRTSSDKDWLGRPPLLQNVRTFTTAAMPTTLAPSTGLTGVSSIVMGDYSDLVVGVRLEPQVEVLRERYSGAYQFGYLAAMRMDVQPIRPSSFERIDRIST